MHSTRMQTPGMALAALCAAFALTLGTPRTVIAQSHAQTVRTSQEVAGTCAEQHGHAFVSQPLGGYLDRAAQQLPAPHAASRLQPEEMVYAELQVPAALLRTLGMEEEIGRTSELQVPAALLATLAAEGGGQMPQRSPELCGPFFSLY